MEKKYISPSGLSHYDEKIKEYIDTKAPSIGDGTVTGAIESLDSNKLDKTGDSKDNTTSFTSNDSTSVSEWTDVSTLTSGEKHTSIFSKTSQMFKNVRYLWKLMGTTDISSIGDGTVTGAIESLNENKLGKTANAVSASKLSNTSAIGSATQPVYFNANGVPVAGTYSLNKTVPSDAKFTDTTYSNATTSANGLMSSTDKSKLDGVAANANNYSLPTATSSVLGGVKVGSNITLSGDVISLSKTNVTSALGYTPPTANTDTKNTAGSTDTSSKIFLVGATSQAANPQTYSHDTAYVGTDGCVYSGGKKTSVEGHTHNYAGSSSAGGAATSANKLNTNAGSATNPIYFANGIPKACSYSLNKTVPSDAKFTDTDTWRGIQNNLTSTSTTDSLSAYQGKLLNDKVEKLGMPYLLGEKSPIKITNDDTYYTLSHGNISNYRYLEFVFYFVNSSGDIIGGHQYTSGMIPVPLFASNYDYARFATISFYDMHDNVGILLRFNYLSNTSTEIHRYTNTIGKTNWDTIDGYVELNGIK